MYLAKSPIAPKTFFSGLFTILLIFSCNVYANKHESLILNGVSNVVELNNEIYLGGLYLESLNTNNSETSLKNDKGYKRMDIRVKTLEWRERNFAQTWNRAILINNPDSTKKSLAKEINSFIHILQSPLIQGDQLTIDYTPQQGTIVSLNGYQLLEIKQEEFFNLLLNCWIGNVPPSSAFKKNIMQINYKDANTAAILRRFEYLAPQEQLDARSKEIAKWKGIIPKAEKTSSISSKIDPKSPLGMYVISLNRESQRRSVYPDEGLIKDGINGVVILNITLNNKGELKNASITQGDKFEPFNTAALKAVHNAKYKAFPPQLNAEEQSFTVKIKFESPNPTFKRIGN